MSRDGTPPQQPQDPATPLVTVGIPVYNGAAHLAEAITSVLGQDYPNLEIVVCDNASDDGTPAIARRFVHADSRVRYLRNPSNIGLLPNFRRVRDEARGTYFTWLGHDDLLSSPSYVSTGIEFLETHPEVVLCHTWIELLTPTGETQVVEFPELLPDRRWTDARRDLFRWPQDWLEMASHGIFRRDELLRVPLPERTRTRRPHVFCWEINLLTTLALRGRIVALPRTLRTYRSSPESAARLMGRSVSPFDLALLDLETKLALLGRAVRAPGTAPERVLLAATAAGNFGSSTFRRRFDHRVAIRLVEQEAALLLRAAHERSKLYESLLNEIEARRRILIDRGEEPGPFVRAPIEAVPQPGPNLRPDRRRTTNFFRPPSEEQIRWHGALSERVAALRTFCERQLDEIHRAEAHAVALLSRI